MEAVKEIALPKIKGNPVDQLPENLYVPPKALLLLLDVFSGPMDFLLYLIQRKNLDILEVNLVDITDQYIAYIEMMEDFEDELDGDYLAMAAYLAESKSRILLPREEESEKELLFRVSFLSDIALKTLHICRSCALIHIFLTCAI